MRFFFAWFLQVYLFKVLELTISFSSGQLTVSSEIKTVRESSAVRRDDSTGKHGFMRVVMDLFRL